jgi:hypothetical protein
MSQFNLCAAYSDENKAEFIVDAVLVSTRSCAQAVEILDLPRAVFTIEMILVSDPGFPSDFLLF